MGFNKSSSSTSAGYSDPETQGLRDWFKDTILGKLDPSKSYSGGSYNPLTGEGGGNYSGARSGGLYDMFSDTGANVFTGNGSYTPTSYSAYQFQSPEVTDEQFGASQDMIEKNLQRLSNSTLQKAQDNASYRGGPGGGGADMAEWRAANANRDYQAQLGDQTRQLAEKRLGMNYEGNMWQQAQQAAENMNAAKFGEAGKQFGAGFQQDYMKNKLAEIMGNKESLQSLLQLLAGFTESGQEKSSSKSSGVGVSAPKIG